MLTLIDNLVKTEVLDNSTIKVFLIPVILLLAICGSASAVNNNIVTYPKDQLNEAWLDFYSQNQYETILKANREKPELLSDYDSYILAKTYFQVEDFKNSLHYLEQIRMKAKQNGTLLSMIYFQAFLTHLKSGKVKKAISSLHLAIEKHIPSSLISKSIDEIKLISGPEFSNIEVFFPIMKLIYKVYPDQREDLDFLYLYLSSYS